MDADVGLIGGGIVGLATALSIQNSNPHLKIIIFEKEDSLGKHQTGNNSGVLHSGIYYKPGSLKATNCVRGYNLMLAFCRQNELPTNVCGKIVVATEEQELATLQEIYKRGLNNGLKGLKLLGESELKEYEPHVVGKAGIFVPQTGIVNYKRVAEKCGDLLTLSGAQIHLNEKVINVKENNIVTDINKYSVRVIVNCAGLYSDKIAKFSIDKLGVRIVPFRGEYYKLKKEKEYLVNNLIYPVPDPNFPFLGVHFTRMIEGGVEAGPNAILAFSKEGYKKTDINIKELIQCLAWPGFQKVAKRYWRMGMHELMRSYSKKLFTKALKKLIPAVQVDDLVEGGAGVRAQACSIDGKLIDDFLIVETENVVNVLNAPSPAATASFAIGENISKRVMSRL